MIELSFSVGHERDEGWCSECSTAKCRSRGRGPLILAEVESRRPKRPISRLRLVQLRLCPEHAQSLAGALQSARGALQGVLDELSDHLHEPA